MFPFHTETVPSIAWAMPGYVPTRRRASEAYALEVFHVLNTAISAAYVTQEHPRTQRRVAKKVPSNVGSCCGSVDWAEQPMPLSFAPPITEGNK